MLILAAILAIFVYGVIAAMLGTILPDLSKKFGLTPRQNGTIATAQAIGLVIASLGVGPLIDTNGKKIALLIGLALVTLALLRLPRSSGFTSVVTAIFILGLGGGIIVTGANALASDVNPEARGTTLNLLNLFFGLGGLATPFISANLLKGDSVKLCYTAAILALLTLGVHLIAPIPGAPAVGSATFPDFGALLSSPTLLLISLMLFLYVAAEVGVWNWLVRHLVAQGIPEAKALNTLSLGFALGLLLGRVAVSPILISVPAKTVTLGAAIVMAVTTYMMLQARTPSLAGFWVFLAGIAMAPVFPTALAMVGDAFKENTATAMGIAITCGWLGLVASSPIIGSIGGGDAKNLKKALLVLPAASVLLILVNLAL
ncbi:MAG: MFS transporter [Bryobacteraceae bacterium]|nr:MFS transporter [Bryobacteraceae bacterium]